MLKTLTIKRFKGIENLDLELKDINIIVGSNNSGKSSILQAIHFAVSIAQSRKLLGDQSSMTSETVSFTIASQQILYTPLNDVMSLAMNRQLTQGNTKAITIEFELESGYQGSVMVKRGKNKNLSISLSGQQVISYLEDIKLPFSVYVPGLAGISKTESFVAYGLLLRAVARGDANLVLRNVLYKLKQDTNKWQLFMSSLQEVFPDTDILVKFDDSVDEFIDVVMNKNSIELPLDSAGTGFLQTTQIFSYIYWFEPKVVLLDEPDSHLHPNNQRSLAKVLTQIARDKSIQVLIATHSRHILDSLESINRIWLRQGSLQPYSNHQYIDVLVDLGALDSAEGLLTRQIKYVVLTEDEDKKMMQIFLQSFKDRNEFMIWSYKGCSKFETAEILAKFIKEVSSTTEIIIHRDADYFLGSEFLHFQRKYTSYGIKVFFTSGVDIEAYFCRLNHLKKLNSGYENEVTQAYQEAINECLTFFKEKAYKGRDNLRKFLYTEKLPVMGDQECRNWADSLDYTEERWIHGKKFISTIRTKFRTLTNRNLEDVKTSEYLQDSLLESLL